MERRQGAVEQMGSGHKRLVGSWTLHEGLAWIERVLMLMVEIASRISGAPLGDRAGLEIEVE